MKSSYPNSPTVANLMKYFGPYFKDMTCPTTESLVMLMCSMYVLGNVSSVRSLHEGFLKEHLGKCLNSIYYSINHARSVDGGCGFGVVTAGKLLDLAAPGTVVELIVDDTLVEKYGQCFALLSRLFDHTAKDGQPWINGHDFVTLMMSVLVPCVDGQDFMRLVVPIAHRMWEPGGKSKLEIAREMIEEQKPLLQERPVVLLMDSWYAKDPLLDIRNGWPELEIVCACRIDTRMYDLPDPPTGKRGRPPKYGRVIRADRAGYEEKKRRRKKKSADGGDVEAEEHGEEPVEDFHPAPCAMKGYLAATRRVIMPIFGSEPVHAVVTCREDGSESRRLFASTMEPKKLARLFGLSEDPANEADAVLKVYAHRWGIESCYQEMKTFWGFEDYMLRSADGISALINLETIAYAATRILPLVDPSLASERGRSAQEIRRVLGRRISKELFSSGLTAWVQTQEIPPDLCAAFVQLVRDYGRAA